MSRKLGSLTFEKERRPLFLDVAMAPTRAYSENTAMEIDKEVSELVNEAYDKVKAIIQQKKDKLEKLLLEKEVIEGEELRKLLTEKK